MSKYAFRRGFAAVLLLLMTFVMAGAQESRGSLTGTVTDPNGAALPGATVEIRNVETNIANTATTNEEGSYTFPLLNPGHYTITVTAQGFSSTTRENIEIRVADKVTLDIPLTVHMGPQTQLALLCDVVDALAGQGVRKLVVLNGHGGNDFRAMLRELQATRPDTFACTVNWWSCVDARPYFDEPGDHGGELETSLMLHIAPHLVRPLEEAGPGRARPWAIAGIREGWAWAPRRWTAVTDDTGVGDPRRATAEKGARFFDAVCERIAGLLADVAAADPARLYEP